MAWQRSGPERIAEWLRLFIRAGFLATGIVGSLLLVYLAIETALLVVHITEHVMFEMYR